jgi:hypothetical protein
MLDVKFQNILSFLIVCFANMGEKNVRGDIDTWELRMWSVKGEHVYDKSFIKTVT